MLTTIEKVLLLQGVKMFLHTEIEHLVNIAALAREVRFEKGDLIFTEGDRIDAVYIMVEGTVSLRIDSHEIVIKEKEAFGWGDLYENGLRKMTATACGPTMALAIGREEFFDLLSDHFDIVRSMLHYFTTLSVHLDYMARVTPVPDNTGPST
ncbi:MAG TPA: cyclic nucleotide-binding domain-containing protein [Nitrospira sp.]|nr:cyclic nucleotide-binding domain-containing protein [Nitrospira sp.]